jgi:hypothetical protein
VIFVDELPLNGAAKTDRVAVTRLVHERLANAVLGEAEAAQ